MADRTFKIVQMGPRGCVTTLEHLLCMDFHEVFFEHLLCMDFHEVLYRNGPSGAETLADGVAIPHHTNSQTCL